MSRVEQMDAAREAVTLALHTKLEAEQDRDLAAFARARAALAARCREYNAIIAKATPDELREHRATLNQRVSA